MFEPAFRWLLQSGIQEPGGGVARFYRTDLQKNAPVSTEITGYTASALFYLHPLASGDGSLDAAIQAARFLTRTAWCADTATVPFEIGSPYAYFFDVGIIARALQAAWSATLEEEFAARARDTALSLAFDFLGDRAFHPIITLPDKQPLPYEPARWSRSPGCYQLKAALAWKELGEVFGDRDLIRSFESALQLALATHEKFLPGVSEPERVMDRLHPYSYFLEALLQVADRAECRRALVTGMALVGKYLREISPAFERSDVSAQLLRVRLYAHHVWNLPLDERAAAEEAARAASFQARSDDPRIDGGFWFGRKNGKFLPYVNPVSTVFCMQALAMWRDHCSGSLRFGLNQLI